MADVATRIGRAKPQYVCSTPKNVCGGRNTKYSNGIKDAPKTHSTPQEAQRCYVRYLLSQGYTQLGPREFSLNGGPILLLNKASKGTRLRGGKADRYMGRMTTGGFMSSI